MQINKKNNRWELRYDFKDSYGKRNHRKKVFDTKQQAINFYVEQQSKINDGVLGSNLNLEQYLHEWMHYTQPDIAPTTYERYANLIKSNILPILGKKQLDLINGWDVEDMLNINKRKGYSQYTIKHVYRLLFTAMKRAQRRRIITFNPVAEVDVPKVKKSEVQALPIKHQVSMLNQLDKDFVANKKEGEMFCWQNKLFFTLCLDLGLRRGECAGLKWEDFDLDRNILRLTRSISIKDNKVNQIFIKGTKTNKPRNIDIDSATLKVIKNYRAFVSQFVLSHKLQDIKSSDWVFISLNIDNNYPVVSPTLWTNRFKSVLARAEIKPYERINMQTNELEFKHWNIHSLRHTHASNLLSDPNVPLKAISNRLGHSTIAATCDIYGHMMDELTGGVFQEAMNNLNSKRLELG